VKTFFTEGNVVLRIGLLVLFFGVSFLLKYAADHDIISIELRLLCVALAAMLLLAWGWHERQQRPGFALLAQGGGVGILFLTVFAAYKLYALVPLPLTFALMLGMVATSTALALLQDARSLALFGVLGGFFAPLLLSSGSGNHVALFGYYALLNSGLLAIAWFRAWRELNLLGFLCTFGLAGLWGFRAYEPAHFLSVEFFLLLFYLMFTGMGVLFAFQKTPKVQGSMDGTLVLGTPLVCFSFQALLVNENPYSLAFTALGLSFFYVGLAFVVWKKGQTGWRQNLRRLTEVLLVLGLIFATVAVPLALQGKWVALIWGIEGAALLWLGLHHKRILARCVGLALQLAAAYFLLRGNHAGQEDILILNGFYLGAVLIAVAALFSSFSLYKGEQHLHPLEGKHHLLLFLWGCLWWFGAGIYEINLHIPYHSEDLASLLFLGLSATVLILLAVRLSWPPAAWPTLFLLPVITLIALGKIGCYSFHHGDHFFAHWGCLAWPLIFIILWYNLFLGRKQLPPGLLNCTHLGTYLLLTLVLTVEAVWFVQGLVPPRTSWTLLPWALVPAVLLGLVHQRHLIRLWPLTDSARTYQQQGGGILVLGLWMWMLLTALGHAGQAPPVPFIPLLNPLELSQLALLLLLLHWLRVHRTEGCLARISQPFLIGLIAGTVFLWLNTVLARAVHHWGQVSFRLQALLDSQLYQTSLSLFWALLALSLMVLADRWRNRSLWFMGSILIAGTVLKLFLMDLANSGTVERIVSFVAVGLILLFIGYLTPLPPLDKQEASP
jgi:uncharacterized membrane protein